MKRLEGKVALVTGGAMGIGESACRLMAREGALVAVTDLDEAHGRRVAQAIGAAGGEAHYWRLDVAEEAQVREVFLDAAHRFGPLTALVNNAGISGANKPTHELSVEEWDRVQAVNVKGVFLCTKHAIPQMRKAGGGSIVNLSSIYGLVGAPDVPPYHASKGAVRLMTKTDALLYAADRIRVNSIHPGFIWTPMVERHLQTLPDPQAANLASDESKFITGAELVVDGGYTCR